MPREVPLFVFFRRGGYEGRSVREGEDPGAWPDFFHLVEGLERPYMQIGFHKNGRRMLLRKRLVTDDLIDDEEGRRQRQGKTIIEERDREMVRKFEEIGRSHTRNMSSGYMRQVPKSFFVESGRDLSDG
jgi:hypothetical protein